LNDTKKPVAVVIGATSKWQSDGRNTRLAHGTNIDDSDLPEGVREEGAGSFLISNIAASLGGRKRMTGQSLYYPRVMMRTLAQVLTKEYSEYGVHVANIVIDGLIDSPGTHALARA